MPPPTTKNHGSRSGSLRWRPPLSNWWSSNLSPHNVDLWQRWHRQYGRLGRRHETETPEGPSVIEDYRPWDQEYRTAQQREAWVLSGPRGLLAQRAHPDRTLQQSSSQATRTNDVVVNVDDFLRGRTSPDQPMNDPAASSESVLGAASDEADGSTEGRSTTLEKGKQREGDPPPSSSEGPSTDPPRGRPRSRSEAARRLAEARVKNGFCAELPSDGLGVIYTQSLNPRPPLATTRPSPSAMERTQSRRGEPSPGSKDYAEMVAESNRRLDELSPYSPEDKAPDTPMPTPAILATDNDEQPPQLPPLPPAEFDDLSDGQVAPLAGNSPNEKSTTTLRAKRSASEISGDDPGGPSRNQEHVLQSPAQSKTVATTTVDGHKRCISEKELRAMCLQPPLPIQKELYKVYSVLVQIVQAAADDFSVVDPHDFIEALSWSESREAGDVEIIRRLRTQTLIAGGICKKLVVPFSHDADIFLVVVNLTTRTFRILDPRTREQLQSKEKIDNRDLYMCVWLFMRTLFPRECPPMSLWSMSLGFTVPLSTPINEPGIVSGNYLNDFGVRLDLPTVLPFFYEVLRIVAGVEAQVAYSDVMLLKRLFAAFEESPIAERTRVLNDLREGSDKNLHYILDDQMRTVLREKNFVFRKAVAGTNPSLGGNCRPEQLLNFKLSARERLRTVVTESHTQALSLTSQHAHLHFILEFMLQRCLRTKVALHYGVIDNLAAAWFFSVDASEQVLQPDLVLNEWKCQGLNNLSRKLQAMRTELDCWLEQCHLYLNTVGI